MAHQEVVSHRERLLRSGTKLIYQNGFHGTTVDAVLLDAAVPKGSFYHHFGSKDVFGQAVLDRYMDFQFTLFAKWAAKKNLSTADKLTGYAGEMSKIFVRSGYRHGCLAGKLSTEVSVTSDVFRSKLNAHIHAWTAELIALLSAGQAKGDVRTDRAPQDLGAAVLAAIQGTFVLALSTRDRQSLSALEDTLRLIVEP